jgi:hypothetical protein
LVDRAFFRRILFGLRCPDAFARQNAAQPGNRVCCFTSRNVLPAFWNTPMACRAGTRAANLFAPLTEGEAATRQPGARGGGNDEALNWLSASTARPASHDTTRTRATPANDPDCAVDDVQHPDAARGVGSQCGTRFLQFETVTTRLEHACTRSCVCGYSARKIGGSGSTALLTLPQSGKAGNEEPITVDDRSQTLDRVLRTTCARPSSALHDVGGGND